MHLYQEGRHEEKKHVSKIQTRKNMGRREEQFQAPNQAERKKKRSSGGPWHSERAVDRLQQALQCWNGRVIMIIRNNK